MNKANLTALLKAVKAMIMRERVAYKDYLGEETVTRMLISGTLPNGESLLTLEDATFTGFVVGETYQVTIDGQATDCVAALWYESIIVSVGDINSNNGAIVGFTSQGPASMAAGSYVGKSITVSQTKTTKKYRTKKLPTELLPDGLAKSADVSKVAAAARNAQLDAVEAYNRAVTANNTAEAAQRTAVSANETAVVAKGTANAAQTAATQAQTIATQAQATANGAVRGIKQGNEMWYSLEDRKDQTDRVSTLFGYTGGNVLEIRVTKASASVPPTLTFSPPTFLSKQADFAFTRATSAYPHPKITEIGGIVMYASDDASKKFLITVNSSGTLSAAEVTDAS